MRRAMIVVVIALGVMMISGSALADHGNATCSGVVVAGEVLEVHGQHVIEDYVTGPGNDLDWPPAGQFNAAGGAAIPGGSGQGHLANGVAPGASFCNSQAQSPGLHLP